MLSAYLMKKLNPVGSKKSKGLMKYGKLILGAYLLGKLKSEKSEKKGGLEKLVEPQEFEESVESDVSELGKGSSMRIIKFIMGALVGATAVYALKKYSGKKSGHTIAVEWG